MKIITFGRHTSNEVVVNDSKVSRNHLQIIQDDNGNFVLVDLNSTNGTYVNGKKVTGEVVLNPNDTVRIGDTAVVWQEYFLQQQSTYQSQEAESALIHKKTKRRRKTWIIAAVVVLLLAGGGATFYFVNKAKNERIETEAKQKAESEANALAEQKRKEVEEAQSNADKLRVEAEAATRKALISKSKEDQAVAEKAQEAAKKAQTEADKKAKELDDAKAKIKNLEKEKESLEGEKKSLSDENKTLEESVTKTQEELSKEQKEKAEAQKATDLTFKFSENLLELSEKDCKKVCEKLKFIKPKEVKDYKTFILQQFNKANNMEKEKILNKVTDESATSKKDANELTNSFNSIINNKFISPDKKTDFQERFNTADNEDKQKIIKEIEMIIKEQQAQSVQTADTAQKHQQP